MRTRSWTLGIVVAMALITGGCTTRMSMDTNEQSGYVHDGYVLTCTDVETTACEARADGLKATYEGRNRTIRTTAMEIGHAAGPDGSRYTYCWERRPPYDLLAPWMGKLSSGCTQGHDLSARP